MLAKSKFFKFGKVTDSPVYLGTMAVEQSRLVANVGIPFVVKVTSDIPITDNFAVPLTGIFGSEGRTIELAFVNGVAERELTFEKSGEWQVTENEINAYLPAGKKFMFDGLIISVAE